MAKKKVKNSTKEFEKARTMNGESECVLRLYVNGTTLKSINAVRNIKNICEIQLKGAYELEVIDIRQQPSLAKGDQIIATPTLLKKLPLPLRSFIGDMSDTDRIILGLDLRQNRK